MRNHWNIYLFTWSGSHKHILKTAVGNSFTDIRGSQLRERKVSYFLKQFSQNDKKKKKNLNKANKKQKQKLEALLSVSSAFNNHSLWLKSKQKKILRQMQKRWAKIFHHLHSRPQGKEKGAVSMPLLFGRYMITMNEKVTHSTQTHCALSSIKSIRNIIALHLKSLHSFHILNLVVTKDGNSIVYTIKI